MEVIREEERQGGAQLDALIQSGQLSSAVLASLPGTAVLVFDRDLRVRHAAGQALERHGWVPERMEGFTFEELTAAEAREAIEPHLRAALGGEVARFDRTSSDGGALYRNELAPRSAGGETVGCVLIARDITEARAATAALAASERRYRMLAENATDLISRHSADSSFLYASPSARELLGRDPGELLGVRAVGLHHP